MGEPEKESRPDEQAAVNPPPGASAGEREGHPDFWRWMTITVAAGLAAGVASWAVGEASYGAFKTPLSPVQVGPIVMMQETLPFTKISDAKNATLAFAVMGGVLGLFLGAAGGVVRRAPSRSAFAGLAGLVLGGLSGTLSSWPLLALYYRQHVPDPNDLLFPLMVLGGIWSITGAAGGLAFGLGSGRPRHLFNAASGAFLGVLLATILYGVIGVIIFPDSNPTDPLAKSGALRFLARVLVSVSGAMGAAVGSWDPRWSRER